MESLKVGSHETTKSQVFASRYKCYKILFRSIYKVQHVIIDTSYKSEGLAGYNTGIKAEKSPIGVNLLLPCCLKKQQACLLSRTELCLSCRSECHESHLKAVSLLKWCLPQKPCLCEYPQYTAKPWIWEFITDNRPDPEGKPRGRVGYLAILLRVAMV